MQALTQQQLKDRFKEMKAKDVNDLIKEASS